MPLVFRLVGRGVGKVSGLVQGGQARMSELSKGSELVQVISLYPRNRMWPRREMLAARDRRAVLLAPGVGMAPTAAAAAAVFVVDCWCWLSLSLLPFSLNNSSPLSLIRPGSQECAVSGQ